MITTKTPEINLEEFIEDWGNREPKIKVSRTVEW